MKINFDKKNDIMKIKFHEGKYEVSKEVDDGIILDMTKDKKLIAIEIINVSEKISSKDIKEITTVASQ